MGTYEDEAMYGKLAEALGALNLKVFKPVIELPSDSRSVVKDGVALERVEDL